MKQFYPEGWLLETEQNKRAQLSLNTLAEACESEQVMEARALICDAEHNLLVDLGGIKGMIPREEGAVGIREGTARDIALISRVNKPVAFIITGLTEDGDGNIVAMLSRRLAQERCMNEYLSCLSSGDIIPAKVTHLEPFGAFCDIGCGIVSLIPIDAISISRIFHPSDRFTPGDDIHVVIRGRDEKGRINLSHKELLGTWEENAAEFFQGETVSGIVRTVEPYGAFVELSPNLAGLAEPKEGIEEGQLASVYIKSILPDKMKIKLIIIDAFHGKYTKQPLNYKFNGSHLDFWQYSPICCSKSVFTDFRS